MNSWIPVLILLCRKSSFKEFHAEGRIGSRFVKRWVNGAAVHTQMSIRYACLEGTGGSRATQAAGLYQQQLHFLMEKSKRYLKSATAVSLQQPFTSEFGSWNKKVSQKKEKNNLVILYRKRLTLNLNMKDWICCHRFSLKTCRFQLRFWPWIIWC